MIPFEVLLSHCLEGESIPPFEIGKAGGPLRAKRHDGSSHRSSLCAMGLFSMPTWTRRPKVAPETPETGFRMMLRGEVKGILLGSHEQVKGLVVVDLKESETIEKWSAENPGCELEVGHVIIEVNGSTDTLVMLESLRSEAEKLNILVNRRATSQQRALFRFCRRKFERAARVEQAVQDLPTHCCTHETCAICHCDMAGGCSQLRCGHVFHKECVTKWLTGGKLRCPLCNAGVRLPKKRRLRSEDVIEIFG